jgi:hypothetical protein
MSRSFSDSEVTKAVAKLAASDQWKMRVGRSQTRTAWVASVCMLVLTWES